MKSPKKLMAGGLLAGLLAGGGAGLILTQGGFAGASDSVAVAVVEDDGTTSTDATDAATADADRSARLREVLQPLVDDGTLTAAQLDAVVTTLDAARPEGMSRGGHGGRGDHGGPGHGGRGPGLEAAATALGLTAEEVHTALHDGQTIAELATANGVEVQAVIDALVADAQTKLAEAVTAGDITQDEADTKLADITTRITDFVNNGRPDREADDVPVATDA
jgi:hypothetical protein